VVGEEEWVGRQGENKGLVQCENLGGGIAVTMAYDPLSYNYCKRHGRWAKEVVRDGGSVDEVMRDGGDWGQRDERMKRR